MLCLVSRTLGARPLRLRAMLISMSLLAASLSAPLYAQDAVVPGTSAGEQAAQAMPDTPVEYEAAINQAVDEHERGNFEEAREHFRKAHAVFPNARTLRGLGKVEFELRNYQQAASFLDAALASQVRPLTPDLRTEVEQLRERAQAYIGVVHIDTVPETTVISLDGVAVANGPSAELTLGVGVHLIEFQAAGRLPQRREVRVNGREQIALSVTLLTPELPASSLLDDPSERKPSAPPVYRKWWVWTIAGAAVAGAVTAVALTARRDPGAPAMEDPTVMKVPNP
jgi:hypothetical protein